MKKNRINETVCIAGMAVLATVGTGCRTSKMSLLSDRNMIPPPYRAPQLAHNVSAPAAPTMTPAVITPAVIPSSGEQPPLPGDNENPIFVQAGAQDGQAAPQDVASPDDLSPKTGDGANKATGAQQPAATKRTYTVVKGDTLSGIAYMYKISWTELAAENNLTEKSILKVNQKLTLPAHAAETPRPRQQPRPSVKPAPKAPAAAGSNAGAKADAPKTAKRPLPPDGMYKVVAGDNLWVIAKRFGIRSADIQAANPSVNFDNLQINEMIKLPGAPTAGAATPKAAKEPKKELKQANEATAPAPVSAQGAAPAPEPPKPVKTQAVIPPAPPITPLAPVPPAVPSVPTTPEFPNTAPAPIVPQPQNTPLVP